MTVRTQAAYNFHVFRGRQARQKRLIYLKIYADNTPEEVRTNTNELIEDLESSPEQDDREALFFGLDFNDKPIGFASIVYYPSKMVGFFDEMAIAKEYRSFSAFAVFVDFIKDHCYRTFPDGRCYVVELSHSTAQREAGLGKERFGRLLHTAGFKRAVAPYFMPHAPLVTNFNESRASLFILDTQGYKQFDSEFFLSIVHLAYYRHYLEWVKKFEQPAFKEKYKRLLDILYDRIENDVRGRDFIALNGNGLSEDFQDTNETPVSEQPVQQGLRIANYALAVLVPSTLSVAVTFTEAPLVVAMVVIPTAIFVGIFIAFRRFRQKVSRFFGIQ